MRLLFIFLPTTLQLVGTQRVCQGVCTCVRCGYVRVSAQLQHIYSI